MKSKRTKKGLVSFVASSCFATAVLGSVSLFQLTTVYAGERIATNVGVLDSSFLDNDPRSKFFYGRLNWQEQGKLVEILLIALNQKEEDVSIEAFAQQHLKMDLLGEYSLLPESAEEEALKEEFLTFLQQTVKENQYIPKEREKFQAIQKLVVDGNVYYTHLFRLVREYIWRFAENEVKQRELKWQKENELRQRKQREGGERRAAERRKRELQAHRRKEALQQKRELSQKEMIGEIDYSRELGSGAYGTVYPTTGGRYVAKVFHHSMSEPDSIALKRQLGSEEELKNFRGVLRPSISFEVSSAGLVDFLKWRSGSVEDLVKAQQHSHSFETKEQLLYAFCTAACSLARIHERGKIHGDLHSGNLFYKGEKNYKLLLGDLHFVSDVPSSEHSLQSYQLYEVQLLARILLNHFSFDSLVRTGDLSSSLAKSLTTALDQAKDGQMSIYQLKEVLSELLKAHSISFEEIEPAASQMVKNHIPLALEMSRHSMDGNLFHQLNDISCGHADPLGKLDFHQELNALDERFMRKN